MVWLLYVVFFVRFKCVRMCWRRLSLRLLSCGQYGHLNRWLPDDTEHSKRICRSSPFFVLYVFSQKWHSWRALSTPFCWISIEYQPVEDTNCTWLDSRILSTKSTKHTTNRTYNRKSFAAFSIFETQFSLIFYILKISLNKFKKTFFSRSLWLALE